MSALATVATALAVLAAAGPGGRRPPRQGPDDGRGEPARGRPAGADLTAVLTAVAALLRTGVPPSVAWARVLAAGSAVATVPTVAQLLGTSEHADGRSRPRGAQGAAVRRRPGSAGLVRVPGTWRPRAADAGAVERAVAVVAAARLADDLGAPLADVLDRVASAVAADQQAERELDAALSGPRATARVLSWLPLLGVALGVVLGADPLGAVLGGGVGAAAVVGGVVLLGAGRLWVRALLGTARARVRRRAGRVDAGG